MYLYGTAPEAENKNPAPSKLFIFSVSLHLQALAIFAALVVELNEAGDVKSRIGGLARPLVLCTHRPRTARPSVLAKGESRKASTWGTALALILCWKCNDKEGFRVYYG